MKLLIVDDEQLTRKGIQESLDLKALSVDQVILADDGLHGLEEAKKIHLIWSLPMFACPG